MAQIINNPEIPHISPINSGLSPGTLIRIQGTAAPTAQRFNINLQCGPNVSPRDDIALHLSVRVADNCVGRNILDKQMWGEEQNQGGNPIGAGQQFEILILCDQMDYKIAINGRHFCEFPHKIPFNRVSHLTIDGDVTMRLLSFEMTAPPAAATAPPPSGPMPGYGGPPMYGPPGGGYGQQQYGGYGPPPPPGHADAEKSGGGFEGFLGQAGTAIAGAFGQAVLQGALSGKQNPNQAQPTQQGGQAAAGGGGGGLGSIGSFLASTLSNQQAPSQPHPPQQPQQPLAGGYGGQSVGGLGSIGSFLTSTLANTVLKPQQHSQPK